MLKTVNITRLKAPAKKLKAQSHPPALSIYTIGYSTHPLDAFIKLLKAHEIHLIIDIRTVPRSRHSPEYNEDALKASLKKVKIGYSHLKDLGGLRRAIKDSINTGWINASFRGFADYMQTRTFEKGLEKLVKMAGKKRCALMCAEGVPWRCHRNLVADALTVKKIQVFHIQSRKTAKLHTLTPFLDVKEGMLFYPKKNL